MMTYNYGHRLDLPNGYFVSKSGDGTWQIGKDGAYLGFNISSNAPVGRGSSMDREMQSLAKGLLGFDLE